MAAARVFKVEFRIAVAQRIGVRSAESCGDRRSNPHRKTFYACKAKTPYRAKTCRWLTRCRRTMFPG